MLPADDWYGAAGLCCTVEQIFKGLFNRARPPWTKVQVQWVFPGEQLSFPSGHTIRAFYLCFLLADSQLTGRYLPLAPSPLWLLPWAAAVGCARVAKGRHFPLDILFGASIGLFLGVTVPNNPRTKAALWAKTIGGSVICLQWGCFYAIPTFVRWLLSLCGRGGAATAAGKLNQASVGSGLDALGLWAVVMVIFYGFYGYIFLQLVVPEILSSVLPGILLGVGPPQLLESLGLPIATPLSGSHPFDPEWRCHA